MKILDVTDSDFDQDCGDYLEGTAAKKFVEEDYTHVRESGFLYTMSAPILHEDGSYSVLIDEQIEE